MVSDGTTAAHGRIVSGRLDRLLTVWLHRVLCPLMPTMVAGGKGRNVCNTDRARSD